MNAFFVTLICSAVCLVSCSRKPAARDDSDSTVATSSSPAPHAPSDEDEGQPAEDEIAEDCVAFVHATKIVPPNNAGADCPGCAASAAGVDGLTFQQFELNGVSCNAATCEARVTVHAAFNRGVGTIAGGLAAWISPEQREAYLQGKAPTGSQPFVIKVTYKRTDGRWRAIEFDRADSR